MQAVNQLDTHPGVARGISVKGSGSYMVLVPVLESPLNRKRDGSLTRPSMGEGISLCLPLTIK